MSVEGCFETVPYPYVPPMLKTIIEIRFRSRVKVNIKLKKSKPKSLFHNFAACIEGLRGKLRMCIFLELYEIKYIHIDLVKIMRLLIEM